VNPAPPPLELLELSVAAGAGEATAAGVGDATGACVSVGAGLGVAGAGLGEAWAVVAGGAVVFVLTLELPEQLASTVRQTAAPTISAMILFILLVSPFLILVPFFGAL
jgi:hypothetical protein